MVEWAPLLESFPVLPPPVTLAGMHGMGGGKADANANHSHLGGLEGADKNGPEGERSQSNSQNVSANRQTRCKAA